MLGPSPGGALVGKQGSQPGVNQDLEAAFLSQAASQGWDPEFWSRAAGQGWAPEFWDPVLFRNAANQGVGTSISKQGWEIGLSQGVAWVLHGQK